MVEQAKSLLTHRAILPGIPVSLQMALSGFTVSLKEQADHVTGQVLPARPESLPVAVMVTVYRGSSK